MTREEFREMIAMGWTEEATLREWSHPQYGKFYQAENSDRWYLKRPHEYPQQMGSGYSLRKAIDALVEATSQPEVKPA